MEKRTILAFVLSFVVLIGWSVFFAPKNEQAPSDNQQASNQTVLTSPGEEAGESVVRHDPAQVVEPLQTGVVATEIDQKEVIIDTPLYHAEMTNIGPSFKSFKLKRYRETNDPASPWIELVHQGGDPGKYTLFQFGDQAPALDGALAYGVEENRVELTSGSAPREVRFERRSPEGLLYTQVYRFRPDTYAIDVHLEVRNGSATQVAGVFKAGLTAVPPKKKKSYYSYVGLALYKDGQLEEVELEDPAEEKEFAGDFSWVAFEDDYFITAILPPDELSQGRVKSEMLTNGRLKGIYLPSPVTLSPGDVASTTYSLYAGPRDLGILKSVGHHLGHAVDFGWTDVIAKPLLYLLRFFNQYIHNYGLSIILLTILVKIIFWPLTHKSYKSMKEMQKLQPRMAKIREKYKDNKEMMNREMMGLYKTYKVNPMSGCLPMIIQIPVFFALFRILGSAIELRHAPFFLWIDDLSAPDRLFHFPFDIPLMAPPSGIPVLTLLMGASMFIQQKMTPTPGDPAQAKMMMFLPLIFTFMFINFPSGLVLYWLVNNVLSIGQQYRIQKRSV